MRPRERELVLIEGREALGLALGALTGGGLTTAGMIVPDLMAGRSGDPALMSPLYLLVVVAAVLIWALGLLLVGAPAWAVLHQVGRRGWRSAVISGAGLSLAAALLLGALLGMRDAMPRSVIGFWPEFGLSLIGAVVGLVIQRIAYRRAPPA